MKRSGFLERRTPLKRTAFKRKPGKPLKRSGFKKPAGGFFMINPSEDGKKLLRKCGILATRRKGTLVKKLWDLFSVYVRKNAADEYGRVKCISCPTVAHWKELQAGHYLHAPKTDHVSYDLRNVHPQCAQCNKWRDGNPVPYAEELVRRYGAQVLFELRAVKNASRGLSRQEVEDLVVKFGGLEEENG